MTRLGTLIKQWLPRIAGEILSAGTRQGERANAPPDMADPGALPQFRLDRDLLLPHRRFDGSCVWCLTRSGLSIDGAPPQYTRGAPATVTRVWSDYGAAIEQWCRHYGVPVELVIATICTESSGDAAAARLESGYTSDAATPHRTSVGLMQTLISTARETLAMPAIDRQWLLDPANSIRAGTSYIAQQARMTRYDPPVVACAYNAGAVYEQTGHRNRWKMRQFPIGTGHHADRFVLWLNDCFRVFESHGGAPESSFYECWPRE